MDWAETTARWNENHLSFWICVRLKLDILPYMYVCVRACVRVHVCIVSINHIVPLHVSEYIYPMFPNAGTSPVARWSLVATRRSLFSFRMVPWNGRWARSVIRKSSKMITHGLCASWRFGVSVTALWDDLHRSHRCLSWICQSCESVVPIGHPLRGWVQVAPRSCRSQPQMCCVWHIETSDAICSPQAGLQHTHWISR